ncbi:hypothetical protein J7E62_27730 [Variovorax paradoxus]|nr:hypothetical protein [Variovorax paradoxus]
MTAKFEAFKAALEALCVEHGVCMDASSDYDGIGALWIREVYEDLPAGLDAFLELNYEPAPTPEQIEARKAEEQAQRERMAAYKARSMAQHIEYDEARLAAVMASGDYMKLQSAIDAHAQEQRKQQMRVSTDPTDPAYIDARPRKAWCNDVLIEGWTVADEFRRCVITPEKVHNGAVLIERLPELGAITAESAAEVKEPAAPIDTGFIGMFEHVPDAPAPAVAPAPVAAPVVPAVKHGKRRR